VRRFAADAKYSSEEERIWPPRTVVVRTVEEEKVVSISAAGTGVTVTFELDVDEGTSVSKTASEMALGWI